MAFNVYYAALGREDRMDGIAQVTGFWGIFGF